MFSLFQSIRKVLPFFIVNIMINLGANFAHPVTPTIFKTLGFGDYMFGYALAAMMIVNFLFSPFWGKMNTVFSSRKCLCITCIGYAVGQFFFGMAQTEGQIIVIRAFTGFFTGGVFVSLLNYIINVSENETQRSQYLIINATITAVAGAFGFLVGGVLGELSTSYAIFAQSFILALSGVLALFVCKDDRTEQRGPMNAKELLKEANPFAAFLTSRKFMTVSFAVFFVICVFYSVAQTSFDQSFNYYLTDQFHLTSGYNGVFKAVMGIITLVANSTLCVYLLKKADLKRSLAALFLLGAAMLLCASLIQSLVWFFVFSALFYACCSASLPLIQNVVIRQAKDKDSNLVMGFYNAMKSLGGIIGSLLSGTLYAVGAKLPFIMCLSMFLLCAAGCFLFERREKREAEGAGK